MRISRLLIILMLFSFMSISSAFAVDDKPLLKKDGYLGKYSQSNCKKTSGKTTLQIYQPYIDNITSHGYPDPTITKSLTVDYDEICERKRTDYLSKAEIRKYGKDLDLINVYFKNNQIQGFILKKKFTANPVTGQNFPRAEYKITELGTRDEIITHYK